jgi:hypothetical protein
MPEAKVPVPSVVLPSLKVTVPVGVPPETVTVAVNVTDWPTEEGLTDDVRDVPLPLLRRNTLYVLDILTLFDPEPMLEVTVKVNAPPTGADALKVVLFAM